MKLHRSITEPCRPEQDWENTWAGPDRGLIKCWELGRRDALGEPERAARCLAGQLPPSGWKGGVSRPLKKRTRYGSLSYLAEWQGLRGEDLDIDLDAERTIVCARTGMIVTFTPDNSKYANQRNSSQDEGEPDGSAPGVPEQPLFSSSPH